MKRVIIAAVAFTATTFTYGQTAITEGPVATSNQPATIETTAPADAAQTARNSEDRKPVKIADLPAAVRKELENTEYKGWTPSSAYWVTKEKSSYYEIILSRADERKTVYYNAEGSKLEGTKVD